MFYFGTYTRNLLPNKFQFCCLRTRPLRFKLNSDAYKYKYDTYVRKLTHERTGDARIKIGNTWLSESCQLFTRLETMEFNELTKNKVAKNSNGKQRRAALNYDGVNEDCGPMKTDEVTNENIEQRGSRTRSMNACESGRQNN